MARIDRYRVEPLDELTDRDILLGQDAETGATRQFPISELGQFFSNRLDGATILSGTGAPQDSQGNDGDFYIQTGANPMLYGPKATSWPAGIALSGGQGIQGEQGIQGPEGPRGPEGPQGAIGPAGADGANGAQGPQGIQGVQGDIGPIGPRGSQGIQGERGLQGADGPQGERGARGPQGDVGATGAVGPIGPMGPAGPQGNTGTRGPQGIPGVDGNDGDTGPAGPIGPRGLEGPEGEGITVATDNNDGTITFGTISNPNLITSPDLTGPAGPQGDRGPRGLQGLQGNDGADGADGAIGPAGPQGIQGERGMQGADGAQGIQGPEGQQGPRGNQGPSGISIGYTFNDTPNTGQLLGVNFDATGALNNSLTGYVILPDHISGTAGITVQDTDLDPDFEQAGVVTMDFTGQGVDPIFVDPNDPTRVVINIPGVSNTGTPLPQLTGLMPGITGFDPSVFNNVRQDLTFTPTWALNTRGYPMARVTEVHLFDGDRNQITSQVGTDAIDSGTVSLGAPSQNFENGPLTFIVQVRVQDPTNPSDVDFTMEVMRTLTVNQPVTPGALTITPSHNFANTTDAQFDAGFVERHDNGTITYVVNIPDPGEWEWEPTVSFTLNGRTLTDTIDTNTRTNGGTFQTSSTSGDKTVNQELEVTLTYRQPLRPSNGGSRSVESLHTIQRSFRAGSIRTTSTIDLTTLQDLDTTGDDWNIINFGSTNFPTQEIEVEVQGETSLRAGDGERLVFVVDSNATQINQITIGGIGTRANFTRREIDGYTLLIQNNSSSGTRTFGITLS